MKLSTRVWAVPALFSFMTFGGCSFGGCDLDLGGCASDDECASGEVCGPGWFGNACNVPECTIDEDCGCGQVCVDNECELDQFVNPCPVCEEEGALCDSDFDCCSGVCGEFEECEPDPFPVCAEAGESCTVQADCCAGVCAEGLCAEKKCDASGEPQLVAENPPGLTALSADANNLYWVSEGVLRSAQKAGGRVSVLANDAGAGSCISRFGDRTSWCGDGGDIWRLIDGDGAPFLYALATADVGTLVDSEAGLFWSDASGAIMAAPQPLPSPAELLATTMSGAPPIAVDANSLFFADDVTVSSVPVAGGPPLPLFVGDPLANGGPILALAHDEASVYFVHGMAMTALSKIDSTPSSLGFAASARSLALDATQVFYADSFIARIPKVGGETVVVLDQRVPQSNVLVDDQCVYWVDAEGRILKHSKN